MSERTGLGWPVRADDPQPPVEQGTAAAAEGLGWPLVPTREEGQR